MEINGTRLNTAFVTVSRHLKIAALQVQAVGVWIIVVQYPQLQTVKRKHHEMQISSFDYWLRIVLVKIPVACAACMPVPAQFTRIWELGCTYLAFEGQ